MCSTLQYEILNARTDDRSHDLYHTSQLKLNNNCHCFDQYMCPGEECRTVVIVTEPWPFLDLLPDFIFLFREGTRGGLEEEGAESGRWWERTES